MSTAAALAPPRTPDEFLAWEERRAERHDFRGPARLRLVVGGGLEARIPGGRVFCADVSVVRTARRPDEAIVDDLVVAAAAELLSPRTEGCDATEERCLH